MRYRIVSPNRSYFGRCFTFDVWPLLAAHFPACFACLSAICFTLVPKCEVGRIYKPFGRNRKVRLAKSGRPPDRKLYKRRIPLHSNVYDYALPTTRQSDNKTIHLMTRSGNHTQYPDACLNRPFPAGNDCFRITETLSKAYYPSRGAPSPSICLTTPAAVSPARLTRSKRLLLDAARLIPVHIGSCSLRSIPRHSLRIRRACSPSPSIGIQPKGIYTPYHYKDRTGW